MSTMGFGTVEHKGKLIKYSYPTRKMEETYCYPSNFAQMREEVKIITRNKNIKEEDIHISIVDKYGDNCPSLYLKYEVGLSENELESARNKAKAQAISTYDYEIDMLNRLSAKYKE